MKLTNKRIIQILSHCINKDRRYLTKQNYKKEIVERLNSIPELETNFECRSGISKMVLIPRDLDNKFVIKIPFTGCLNRSGYVPFCWTDNGGTWYPGNYCDIEVERCKHIIKAGWGDFIAKTAFIGIVGDLFVYKQERVDETAEEVYYSSSSPSSSPSFSAYNSTYEDIDEKWLVALMDYMGRDEAIEFIDFLDKYHYSDDLHSANVGFKDGVPVIFDYSSFMD